jgi:L-methionine (R)-S-oxide reductase
MDDSLNTTDFEEWLRGFLSRNGGISGTIHKVTGEFLTLTAVLNIPSPVQATIAQIPCGKGMAGLAWERDQPVTTCNLKEDNSRDISPGAKAVNAGAGVALPVHDATHHVRAIVGIAYRGPRAFAQSEIQALLIEASTLP